MFLPGPTPCFCPSITVQISLPFAFIEIHCSLQGKNDKNTNSTTLNRLEEENEGRRTKRRREGGKRKGKRGERRWGSSKHRGERIFQDRLKLHGVAVQTNNHRLVASNHISTICLQSLSFASCKMGSKKLLLYPHSILCHEEGLRYDLKNVMSPPSLPKNVTDLVKLPGSRALN